MEHLYRIHAHLMRRLTREPGNAALVALIVRIELKMKRAELATCNK